MIHCQQIHHSTMIRLSFPHRDYVVPTRCSWALILCLLCSGRLTRVDLRGAVAKHIKECPQVKSLSKAVKKLDNKIVDEHEWVELVENWLAEQQEVEANAPQETVRACLDLSKESRPRLLMLIL